MPGSDEYEIDLQKFRIGDPDTFERVVRAYYERVYRLSVTLLANPTDAEDAVQDTFLRIHRKAATFRGESSLSTWIYRIAHNICLDALKGRRRRSTHSLQAYETMGRNVPDPHAGPEERAFSADESARVRAALSSLPEEYRVVLVLREVEDLSYDQIADVLKCPVGTVRSRLARGRRQLAKVLEGGVNDDVSSDIGSVASAR